MPTTPMPADLIEFCRRKRLEREAAMTPEEIRLRDVREANAGKAGVLDCINEVLAEKGKASRIAAESYPEGWSPGEYWRHQPEKAARIAAHAARTDIPAVVA